MHRPFLNPTSVMPGPALHQRLWNGFSAILLRVLRWIAALGPALLLHLQRIIAFDLQRVRVTPREETALQIRGVFDADLRRYLAWRRSLLLIALPLTAYHLYWQYHASFLFMPSLAGIWSTLGYVVESIRLLSLVFLTVAVALAILYWKRFRLSTRWLWYGLLSAFVIPVLLAAVPQHFAVNWESLSQESLQQFKKMVETMELPMEEAAAGSKGIDSFLNTARWMVDIVGAVFYGAFLLPSICAIFTGVVRACLRIKTLLPESITPGWYLLSVTPLYLLLLLVVFVVSSVVFREKQLVLSLALFLVAPLLHLLNVGSLSRPWKATSRRYITKVIGWVAIIINLAAFVLFFHYLARVQFNMEGKLYSLFGWNSESAMMEYWDLLNWLIDYVGRWLIITVAVADLLLRATMALWNQAASSAQQPSEMSEKMAQCSRSFQ